MRNQGGKRNDHPFSLKQRAIEIDVIEADLDKEIGVFIGKSTQLFHVIVESPLLHRVEDLRQVEKESARTGNPGSGKHRDR
jgi:hypothetical protein